MKKWASMVLFSALLAGALGYFLADKASLSKAVAEQTGQGRVSKAMYNCAMHPTYISEQPGKCPFCGMDLTLMDKEGNESAPSASGGGHANGQTGSEAATATSHTVRIDPATVQNMGVRAERVGMRELSPEIRTSGRIAVDETRQFYVNARVMGWVEKLHAASTGQLVGKGQALLEIYSPELLNTQEEFLQALRYMRNLGDGAGEETRRGARELLESTRRRLLNWDVPASQIQALEKSGAVKRTVPILSPASGVVLEKMVLQGQNIMPGVPLYRIADLSRIWVIASVYQGDLARVRVGSPAEISLSYLPGKTFNGRVAFISPVLDPATRTAEVRIEASNTRLLDLKPEMFATVILRSPGKEAVLAIPDQAIIRSGRRDVIVVSLGEGLFEPREVKLGRSADGFVEVLEGLRLGEQLVVSSQFLIDSESNLKAAIQQLQSRPKPAEERPPAEITIQGAPSGIEGTVR